MGRKRFGQHTSHRSFYLNRTYQTGAWERTFDNQGKERLELNADGESYLTIDESSTLVNSIVNYSAKGGGEISVQVEGIKRKLHTAQSVNDFNVDEQLIRSNDWDAIDKAFKNILI